MLKRSSLPVILLLAVSLSACGTTKKAKPLVATAAAAPVSQPTPPAASNTELKDAIAQMQKREYAEAEKTLLALTQSQPQLAAAWLNLGLVYANTQRPKEAETRIAHAAKLSPRSAVVMNELGRVRSKLQRHAAALQAYQRAIEFNPQHADAHRNLAILYDLHLNQPDKALTHYQRHAELNPEDKVVQLWIAQIKHQQD